MAFTGMCPYLRNTKKVEVTICECAKFTFPDRQARRDVLYGYCGHTDAWKTCPFKLTMDKYYERKFNGEISAKEKISDDRKRVVTHINCCGEG